MSIPGNSFSGEGVNIPIGGRNSHIVLIASFGRHAPSVGSQYSSSGHWNELVQSSPGVWHESKMQTSSPVQQRSRASPQRVPEQGGRHMPSTHSCPSSQHVSLQMRSDGQLIMSVVDASRPPSSRPVSSPAEPSSSCSASSTPASASPPSDASAPLFGPTGGDSVSQPPHPEEAIASAANETRA